MSRLIERFEPLLQAAVRRHLGPARYQDEGEDLLQTLRLAMVKALPSVKEQDLRSVAAWMKKLVRSRILDWQKSRQAGCRQPDRPVVSLAGTNAPEVAALTPTPSNILIEREELERLQRAIETVPARYRALLRLLYRQNPSPAEVAEFLGKEPEAARKFVARALAHLRQVMKPKGKKTTTFT